MQTVTVDSVWTDAHGEWPESTSFDMSWDQKVRDLTLDDIKAEVRGRALREVPLSCELRRITIEIDFGA